MDKDKSKLIMKTAAVIIFIIMVFTALLLIKNFFSSFSGHFVGDKIVGKEGRVTTVTKSDLEKVVQKSQLYTAEYPYNGYTAVYDENGSIKYYVAYEGTVKAGIDISRITVTVKGDTIIIQLPEVQIKEPTVDAGTMEYIFKNKKYETETVAEEAYRCAENDLAKRVSTDNDLKICATESAKTAERAMIEPWINQTSDGRTYTVKVLGYGEGEQLEN